MADFAALAGQAKAKEEESTTVGFGVPVAPAAASSGGAAADDGEAGGSGGGGGEGNAEEESTAHFEPVVQLEEVEVKTHEEDEETLYKQRAKLFIYGETLLNKGTGIKEWRERGIGDVKFLRHKEAGKTRLLMRQEKTMKVIANHIVDPRIVLVPNAGSDRSWVWTAFDFHDGNLAETVFAIRFGTADSATSFKTQFEASMKEMEKLIVAEGEVDAAADALGGLTVDSGDALAADADAAAPPAAEPAAAPEAEAATA